MATSNSNCHLTLAERQSIEQGIRNGASKTSIAETLGKDKSTIAKEIKNHRFLSYKCKLPLECSNYKHCNHQRKCTIDCIDFKLFKCKRRDRTPGACNGCKDINSCHFNKYKYSACDAHNEYRNSLVNTRSGINATLDEIKNLGELIKPLLAQGQSIYHILQTHPEIKLSEKTLYNYIEDGVFTDAGVPITCLDLKRQIRRKLPKAKKVKYLKRQDRSYLKGRKYSDYVDYMQVNPYANVVEMDTVYNSSTGPFIQTFKFIKYDLLFCVYQESKDSKHMRDGILLLEDILGYELFNEEVAIILTDRGSEFILGDETELREDGTRRTRIFYCDPMASNQKGSLENIHILIRDICPKECDLKELGYTSQVKANLISSNINSYKKEKLKGKNSFQLLEFYSPNVADRFYKFGLKKIEQDKVILKPYLLK